MLVAHCEQQSRGIGLCSAGWETGARDALGTRRIIEALGAWGSLTRASSHRARAIVSWWFPPNTLAFSGRTLPLWLFYPWDNLRVGWGFGEGDDG